MTCAACVGEAVRRGEVVRARGGGGASGEESQYACNAGHHEARKLNSGWSKQEKALAR